MTTEKFNIFGSEKTSLLNENGHSLFLKRLLSPRGKHGLTKFFLETFMKDVLGLSSDEYKDWFKQDWEVESERKAGKGRVDLYLHSRDKKYVIVIENKINNSSKDQKSQLYRYWRNRIYRKKFYNEEDDKELQKFSKLAYLTPNGKSPSDESLKRPKDSAGKYDEFPEVLKVRPICISYKRNPETKSISDWIENCLKKKEFDNNQNPRLFHTLEQYKEWIDNYIEKDF